MSKQSDIARQFDLPERQSKLNTMLREEGLKDEQVYCVCRSSDVTRFMIGCDNCEEWYHGDCINVTETEAGRIRKFYCKKCRAKFPQLQIKYKEKRSHHHKHNKHDKEKEQPKDKDKIISSKSKGDRLGEKCGECEACYIKEDCGRCECCKDMPKFGGMGHLRQKCKKRQCQNFFHLAKKHQQPPSSTKSNTEKHSVEYARSDHSYNSQPKVNKPPQSSNQPQTNKPTTTQSQPQPQSTNATKLPNSSSGGSLIIKSLAEYSSVVPSSTYTSKTTLSTSRDRTPPAPNPKGIPAPNPKGIPAPNPKGIPAHPTSDHKSIDMASLTTTTTTPLTNLTNSTSNGTNKSTSNSTSNNKNDNNNSNNNVSHRLDSFDKNNIIDDVTSNRTNKNSVDQDQPWEPSKKKKTKETISRKRKEMTAMRKRKVQDSGSDSDDPRGPLYGAEPRQCMGPQCIKAARPASKYCCDECGLKLAEARIYSVLPQRIQEWKMSSCIAEENDRKQLEKIRSQQLEARKALQALDEKHKELDVLLAKWKSVSIDPQADEEGDEDGSDTAFIYCVTCGHEVPTRRAIKHMHSCYNKLESQMSFGSMFKTRIEGNNMFCDAFNPINRTYCKRLRVMCPEHTKESKTSNTEVCGFPLTANVFTETGKVCRMSKKKCIKHYCWEKLRRGNIDMERVRQCIKLDELVEQERQVRLAMTNRAGVLGLMLHSTYDHEYAAKMQQRQRQTDHQYHQKDKGSKVSGGAERYKHFKDSTNYYTHYHKQATDHHYHRQKQQQQTPPHQQQDIGVPDSKKLSSVKKYQSKYPATPIVLNTTTVNQPPHNNNPKIQQQPISSNSNNNSNNNNTKANQSSYQREKYLSPDNQLNHDHQYFCNEPSEAVNKRDDHLYSSKRQK